MQFRVILCAAAVVAATLASGCQYSPEMTERAMAYNQAVAKSTNQIILLNIVRASERQPRYFTRFGSNLAQTSFTGSLTVALPFTEFNNGSGISSATAAPSATSGNTVTLDNLDDKKYQVGANTPVDSTTVAQYWHQGLQPDLLGLLFIDSIVLPADELTIIEKEVTDSCASQDASKYCKALSVKVDAAGTQTRVLSQCAVEAPKFRKDGSSYVVFINDPAWDRAADSKHPATCFIVVLRNLLALGLNPLDGKSTTEMETDVADDTVKNPKFRSEMIKLSLKIKPGEIPDHNTVIKEGSQTTFELDSGATKHIAANILADIHADPNGPLAKLFPDGDDRTALGEPPTPPPPCPATRHGAPCKAKKTETALQNLKITPHVRSFEAVVYFLGELVRAETGSKDFPKVDPVLVTILGREPWGAPTGAYEEPLFVVERSTPDETAPVAMTDDYADAYWIPSFCATPSFAKGLSRPTNMPSCSIEYPNHETLTVMTVVDQLWGLQKEPSTSTPATTVSVGK